MTGELHMNDLAIRVAHLGKKYRLGGGPESVGQDADYRTLRDLLAHGVKNSARSLMNLTRRNDAHADIHADARNELWALKDASFDVKRGQVLGIIGANGAGKTTLLKILSRITEPTEGVVDLYGRVGSLLEVGTGFHPELTGRENIFLNGAILGMTQREIRRKLDEIVAFAEIEKFLDTPVKRYSSGMYIRLAFAVAAHMETEILVVDEVLAVGDVAFQRKCLGKMQDAAYGGRTVLLVSHNMTAIRQLCHQVLVMRGGRLILRDQAERAIALYLDEMADGANGERVWRLDEPIQTRGPFVPHAVRVRNQSGQVTDRVWSREPFTIEYEYSLPEAVREFRVGVGLYLGGDCVFWSFNQDDPLEYDETVTPAGTYRAVCHVPADLLAQGTFYVGLYSGKPLTGSLYWPLNVLRFEVDAADGIGSKLNFGNTRAGFLAPKLRWEIMSLHASEGMIR